MSAFANEPVLELRRADVRDSLAGALATLDTRLPLRVPIWIGGDRGSDDDFESTDPGQPSRVVAHAGRASVADVDAAVVAARAGFVDWSSRPAAARAEVLTRAAGLLRVRRLELAGLAVRECAKPWPEADADVCEAIDFLEYYARAAVTLEAGPALVQVAGERNVLRYVPRGVVAAIAPWNFPLAIPAGMVAAGLATGNAVVLKPAEQSPGCALELVAALREAGVPSDAIGLLPGEGEVGAALVQHPGVQTIAFTGSGAVGLEILRAAGEVRTGQFHVKRVIAEMGGKNCILVDSDADLDDAVPAIVRSAFDYAGQKCSAAARVLAHDAITDRLLERLSGAVELLVVGQADELQTDVPPLIEQAALERLGRYRVRASEDGQIVAEGPSGPSQGWFCPPAVVSGLRADSPILRDEIFGPLLTVERVADVDQACEIVEGLPVALTGGLFSRDPATIERVVRRLPVGNLYVNREITGAMVGRQPFGGNRLSGNGTKAGGPDYLLHFVEPRVSSENTVRHGISI